MRSLPQNKLSDNLNITDIYVILSIEEGLSLTIPQAMSVGCIVIATPNTGAEEIIKNGFNGFIINHNYSEFYEVISNLLDDKELRKKISLNAISSLKKNSGFKKYTERLIKCVE
jgi:glycosyltransferase involved in cell wall biosynthesis